MNKPASQTPSRQYRAAYEVLPAMKEEAEFYLGLSPAQTFVLACAGGVFVTFGALFSLLLSTGVTASGPQLLLQGLGFSTGFFMIILSRAALFTEANVILPASFLQMRWAEISAHAFQFWVIAWVGNMVGAVVAGQVIAFAQTYPDYVHEALANVVVKKMAYMDEGTSIAWVKIIVSGMLGNALIGMAAFFATMGNTLFGKFVPVFLVVSLFVAGNLQHSPANMGYFSLSMATGGGPGWDEAIVWNIIPAGIGNILGGAMLVALPFWFAFRRRANGFSE
ncbi:formate/nitrite transporter family protein [Lutimaribacter marinistellae]|uniref:Formate/nitrite transporter family protein n=1 Tax=Lutimaribacter marinistellae TaxID=1820329 RepID=A0ABV7TGD0_9RHOB